MLEGTIDPSTHPFNCIVQSSTSLANPFINSSNIHIAFDTFGYIAFPARRCDLLALFRSRRLLCCLFVACCLLITRVSLSLSLARLSRGPPHPPRTLAQSCASHSWSREAESPSLLSYSGVWSDCLLFLARTRSHTRARSPCSRGSLANANK